MKKILAILAIGFLASCGSGEKTETADSTAVAPTPDSAVVAAPDSAAAATPDSAAAATPDSAAKAN